jgi:hypothetical protein
VRILYDVYTAYNLITCVKYQRKNSMDIPGSQTLLMTPYNKATLPDTHTHIQRHTHTKNPLSNTKTKTKFILYYEQGHKMCRFITGSVESALCFQLFTIRIQNHTVTWQN